MIGDFRDREAQEIFEREKSKRYGSTTRVILHKLLAIEAAISIDKLKSPPGNRLESLHGDREGQYSIRVNDQFRICFVWREGYAYDIEVTDYH